MKKIINNAPPVVVSTTRTPLNGSLTISSGGGALSQVYDALYNSFAPVDREDTPLVLTPVVSVVDPDTGQQVALSSLSAVDIKWYVGNSTTAVSSTTPSDGYYLQTSDGTSTGAKTGALVVRHNVGASDSYAVPILCQLSFTDAGRNEQYKYDAAVLLSTEVKAQNVVSVELECPQTVTFDPIRDTSSQRTFKAKALNGTEDVTAQVKFFWYVDDALANTKACYVSGQNTAALTLDAEYADNVVVKARIAIDTTATTPDHPAKAEATLLWQWPRMKAIPYSQSGESIKLQSQQMSFSSIVQAYGLDISDAKRNRYVKLRWYTQATDATAKTYHGYGYTANIAGSNIFRTGGRKVNVGVDLYLVGAKSAVGGSGAEQLVTNPAPPVVVTTQRTPLTGSLTIASGGGALSQVYDSLSQSYEPVDREDTPLVLSPVVSLTDPDTGQAVPISDLSAVEIRWYVGTATTYVTSRIPSDDYHLQTDDDTATGNATGALVVRHNVGPTDNYAVPLLCELTCTDSSRAETYKFDATVMLSSEVKAQDLLTVQMGNPKTVTFDPIRDDSSQRTFTAKVLNGSEDVTASVKLFWYIDDVLADAHLGYVSGQNTDALTLDADYLDGAVVKAMFAIDTTATAPDHPAKAESTLLWHWPRMQALPYSQSGEAIRSTDEQKKFSAIIQAYGHDVPAAKVQKYCRLNWYTRPTNTTTRTDRGWGDEVTLDGTVLFQTGGAHCNVGVDLYTLGKQIAVVDDVTGETVVDDATGAVVVSGE